MKVGFIFECQPQGADEQVYTYVAKSICEKLQIDNTNISSLGNKPAVINESALHIETMLLKGCQVVFVVWDRMPKWGGSGKCEDHKTDLLKHLSAANIDTSKIRMCCIDEMLESWIIADGRGVTSYFQSFTTKILTPFNDHKKLAEQNNAEDRIKKYNARYNKAVHNLNIVKHLPDFSRAAKWNPSFGEFVNYVNQICTQ